MLYERKDKRYEDTWSNTQTTYVYGSLSAVGSISLLNYSHKDGILSFKYNDRQKATTEYKSSKLTDNTHTNQL